MTTKIERRNLRQELASITLETRSEGGKRYVEGYAAVFHNSSDPMGTQFEMWDGYIERILPGAFDRAAREDDCRCLFNHSANFVLGRTKSGTMTLSIDSRGLKYSCEVPDTQWGRDTLISIERGDLSGSSFSFEVLRESMTRDGEVVYRDILEAKLYDVGPVTFPAYLGTDTSVAKRCLESWQAEQRINRLKARGRQLRLREIFDTEATEGTEKG